MVSSIPITTGGNWKEFWLAASQPNGGDLALVEFHLENGVDPNYQHPEMESTALCESIRAGNIEIVDYLLKYKNKTTNQPAVDPTIPSAYENQTPLEIAMELQNHDIVDLILEALPEETFEEGKKSRRRDEMDNSIQRARDLDRTLCFGICTTLSLRGKRIR